MSKKQLEQVETSYLIGNSLFKSGKYDELTDTLVECPTCSVFISKDEAVLSGGKYFCSKECIKWF